MDGNCNWSVITSIMKVPTIKGDKVKIKNTAFEYPDMSSYKKLPKNPGVEYFASPESVAYYVMNVENTKKLREIYKDMTGQTVNLENEAKASGVTRNSRLDFGFMKNITLYAMLVKYLTCAEFDKKKFKSKLSKTSARSVVNAWRSFEYGDRTNVIDRYGKCKPKLRPKPKKAKETEKEKEAKWPEVVKYAITQGYTKRQCNKHKDRYMKGNRGLFMVALQKDS